MNDAPKSSRLVTAIIVLAVIGAALSAVSLYEYAAQVMGRQFGVDPKPSFCNLGDTFNCDAVTLSRWSAVWGVPLASIGFAFYSTMVLLALVSWMSPRCFERATLLSSVLASVLSVILFLISKFQIGQLCVLCIGMYAVNILMLIGALLWREPENILTALVGGVRCYFGWIPAALGIAADLGLQRMARLSFVGFLLACALGLALPSYLFFDWIIPAAMQEGEQTPEQISAEISAQRAAWAAAEEHAVVGKARGDDFKRGADGAPITVVEYADFECPACQQYYLINEELLSNYGEKVQYIFRNYPLDNSCNPGIKDRFHLNSCYAAELSLCAGEQGKYWEYSDYLFTLDHNQIAEGDVRKVMLKGADTLKLNRQDLEKCVASGRYRPRILREIREADELKLSHTPTIFVNGKSVENYSYPVMAAIFDSILKQSGE